MSGAGDLFLGPARRRNNAAAPPNKKKGKCRKGNAFGRKNPHVSRLRLPLVFLLSNGFGAQKKGLVRGQNNATSEKMNRIQQE